MDLTHHPSKDAVSNHDRGAPGSRRSATQWRLSRPGTWPESLRRRMVAANMVAVILTSTVGVAAAHAQPGRTGALRFLPGFIRNVVGGGIVDLAPERDSLPSGKGMWLYEFDRTENGDAAAIVSRARETGLTHLYMRTGSWIEGFYAGDYLDRLLPVAHAAGIRVFGWDFPRLGDQWPQDVARAQAIVAYRTPDGHGLDGFSADIETPSEGTLISGPVAQAYGAALRGIVGPDYLLVATVPRPSPAHRPDYPYAEIVESFDAVAPMVYWLNRQPDSDVAGALADLAALGKPIFPVGQAYDGEPEGGRAGVPTPNEIERFITTAEDHGAAGVSFWSWQHADVPVFFAIRDAPQFSG